MNRMLTKYAAITDTSFTVLIKVLHGYTHNLRVQKWRTHLDKSDKILIISYYIY